MTATVPVPRFIEAAQDLGEALANYKPDPDEAGSMYVMYRQVGMLPEAFEEIARGFRALADTCEDLPLNAHIRDLIDALAKVQVQAAHSAEAIPEGIALLHADDLERHENPRTGERAWNVPQGGI